jgi:hypothetical protein
MRHAYGFLRTTHVASCCTAMGLTHELVLLSSDSKREKASEINRLINSRVDVTSILSFRTSRQSSAQLFNGFRLFETFIHQTSWRSTRSTLRLCTDYRRQNRNRRSHWIFHYFYNERSDPSDNFVATLRQTQMETRPTEVSACTKMSQLKGDTWQSSVQPLVLVHVAMDAKAYSLRQFLNHVLASLNDTTCKKGNFPDQHVIVSLRMRIKF